MLCSFSPCNGPAERELRPQEQDPVRGGTPRRTLVNVARNSQGRRTLLDVACVRRRGRTPRERKLIPSQTSQSFRQRKLNTIRLQEKIYQAKYFLHLNLFPVAFGR